MAITDLQNGGAIRGALQALSGSVPQTDDDLHRWYATFLGVRLARKAVSSPYASPPFTAVADIHFNRVNGALWLGSRASMKTLGAACVSTSKAIFQPGCDILIAGAIEEQAKRSHEYVLEFLRRRWEDVHPIFNEDDGYDPDEDETFGGNVFGKLSHGHIVADALTAKIRFSNKSKLGVVPATLKKVSGPHPNLSIFDEVELAESWVTLNKWFGMATSSHGWPAQRLLCSTRERIGATMDKLLTQADDRGLKTYSWNVFDSMAPCKKTHGGCLCKKGGGIIDKTACALWDGGCGGKAEFSDGGKTYNDVLTEYKITDEETWITQFLCDRPSRKGAVYHMFENRDPFVSRVAEYSPEKGTILIGTDPGYQDPHVVIFAQRTPYALHIFDLIYEQHVDVDEIKRMLLTGDFPNDANGLPSFRREWFKWTRSSSGVPIPANIDMLVAPYNDPQIVQQWRESHEVDGMLLPSFAVMKAKAEEIEPGLRRVRQRLKVGPYGPGIVIHPRCERGIWELTTGYRHKLDPVTSTYTADVVDRDNHFADALRYLIGRVDSTQSYVPPTK